MECVCVCVWNLVHAHAYHSVACILLFFNAVVITVVIIIMCALMAPMPFLIILQISLFVTFFDASFE